VVLVRVAALVGAQPCGLAGVPRKVPLANPPTYPILDLPLAEDLRPAAQCGQAGRASFAWLDGSSRAGERGQCHALTHRPISQTGVANAAGHAYPGQTDAAGRNSVTAPIPPMLFTARSPHGTWRLNTLWPPPTSPGQRGPQQLRPPPWWRQAGGACWPLRCFGPQTPASWSPGGRLKSHAGESGLLGCEEQDWLIPVAGALRRSHPRGGTHRPPCQPDTCWLGAAAAWRGEALGPDGYLACNQNQGLLPVKLRPSACRSEHSLGLPSCGPSPDHGTVSTSLAWGIARIDEHAAALETAWELG